LLDGSNSPLTGPVELPGGVGSSLTADGSLWIVGATTVGGITYNSVFATSGAVTGGADSGLMLISDSTGIPDSFMTMRFYRNVVDAIGDAWNLYLGGEAGNISIKNSVAATVPIDVQLHASQSAAGFRVKSSAGTRLFSVNSNGYLELAVGGAVNEFSIDGTMAGNSDLAIPTEKAVVTYVGTNLAMAVILAPGTGARNTIVPTADHIGLIVQAANVTTPAANLQEWRTKDGATLAKVSAAGKLTSVDADIGFTDPNSHFQATNANLKDLIEEVGFVVAEETRGWLKPGEVFCPAAWNSAGSAWYAGGSTYGRQCPGASDTTFHHKSYPIPKHYSADGGGNDLLIDIFWMGAAAPASDKIVRIKMSIDDGWSPGEKPNYTNSDFSLSVPSTLDTTLIYKTTLTITSPTIDTAKDNVAIWGRRMGSTDAADTYDATDWWVVGFQIRSPSVKST
jgi:hypothetical protein